MDDKQINLNVKSSSRLPKLIENFVEKNADIENDQVLFVPVCNKLSEIAREIPKQFEKENVYSMCLNKKKNK